MREAWKGNEGQLEKGLMGEGVVKKKNRGNEKEKRREKSEERGPGTRAYSRRRGAQKVGKRGG